MNKCEWRAYSRKRYAENADVRASAIKRAKNWQKRNAILVAARAQAIKTVVLAHYGFRKTLRCRWRGCTIKDIDMLSLDHVENNGAAHRRSMNLL